jgi:hypothetical protein
VAVLGLATVAMVGALVSSPSGAATPPPGVALVYGNTLTWESQKAIAAFAGSRPGWSIQHRSFPNTGPCTWGAWLPADLATYHPTLIAIAPMTNPPDASNPTCGVDGAGAPLALGSAAYFDGFATALRTMFSTAADAGVRVLYFASPPVRDVNRNAVLLRQNEIAQATAASYPGISYSSAARSSLATNNRYVDYKKCLSGETAAQGCGTDGLIAIRTLSAPVQAGNHLCAAGLPDTFPWFCAAYSSGEVRFAKALVDTIVNPPAPILPTLNLSAKAAVEGQPLLFTPKLKFPYSRDLTLCYNTADGTATAAGGDYVPVSDGCVVIPAWSTSAPTIRVTTLLDQVTEPSETVQLRVWGSSTALTKGIRIASGTIKANTT